MSMRGFDVGSMLVHILESGVTLRQLAERLEAGYLSEKLIKHYLKGGVPNLHRGNAIIGMWCEATGLPESEAPMLDWAPAYRTETNQMQTLRPKCECCGQVVRGQALLAWEQKRLFEAGQLTPSWLGGKAVQHDEFQGNQRSIRLSDSEPQGAA